MGHHPVGLRTELQGAFVEAEERRLADPAQFGRVDQLPAVGVYLRLAGDFGDRLKRSGIFLAQGGEGPEL